MKYHSGYNLCRSSLVTIMVGVSLIFSFGLHAVELTHQHPGHEHTNGTYHPGEKETTLVLHEYVHANEQKLFFILVLSLLLIGSFLRPSFLTSSWDSFFGYISLEIFRSVHFQYQVYISFENYIRHMFKSGILHPKLH